ncbi:DUF4412 domain-containing protein [Formosa sp. PL04]|uniref:DUF4412 domain-containing protein n=1 Tax=Formosa sp. PL04 TaxID=3081755 RepID=UPI0029811646|nr:DUF4412 domain-containing protein [Formosa sp. PL04]MDW5290228.1 DUF4412 domain-containing protein [Formosa sp. PL04]
MKTKIILLVVFMFLGVSKSQAQFFKKLKDRVEQTVENVVVEKTADKAAETTSKSMDKVFDMNPFGGGDGKADANQVANSYDFTWKYSLKMTTKQGDMVFDYYLKPDASYFGFTTATMKDMFTVMDNGNNVTVMFMNSKGNNIGMASQMPDDLDLEEMADESAKFKFEVLPNKSINGYDCKGVKATSDEYIMTMYFTNEAEISFDDIYKNQQTNIPVELKKYFDPNDKMLMISMDMKSLKNEKYDAKMECIGLEEVQKTIKKSDYKIM